MFPRSRSPVFELVRDLYVIDTCWFKFEDIIHNDLKVVTFPRNHTEDDADDADDGTKNHMSPPSQGGT